MKTKNKQILAVMKKMKSVGIKTNIIQNKEPGSNIYINLNRGRDIFNFALRKSDENAVSNKNYNISVVGSSKRDRHVVLKISESAHQLDLKFRFHRYVLDSKKLSAKTIGSQHINTQLPPNTTFKIKTYDMKDVFTPETQSRYIHTIHQGVLQAKVKESTQYFLVGYDEDHMFISVLPRAVKSHQDAIDSLTPIEVKGKEGVIRQGEFFFIPATKSEIIKLTTNKSYGSFRTNTNMFVFNKSTEVREYSDHVVQVSREIRSDVFVTGQVGNSRHSTFLNGWYRVVRNLEINSNLTQRRNYD